MGAGHIINYANFHNDSSQSHSSSNKNCPHIIISPLSNIPNTNISIDNNTYYKQTILTISSSDIINDLECEENNILGNVNQPSSKRKRNKRNIREQLKTNETVTKEGITFLNTNEFTTTGGGGLLHHTTDLNREIDDIECRTDNFFDRDGDMSYESKKTLLHKDRNGDYFIHTPKIIQSAPNLKSIYESFINAKINYRKKQMSCHLKSSINLSNIHKHYSFSGFGKNNANNKSDLLLLQISIDDNMNHYHKNKIPPKSKTTNKTTLKRNYCIQQHNKNNYLLPQTQTNSNTNIYNFNITSCLFKDKNNINPNFKSIHKELLSKITTLYDIAKHKQIISDVTEIKNTFNITKTSSIYKELISHDSFIVYSSYLSKMINELNATVPSQAKYSDKFCIITKNHFSYYTSKEKFIMLKQPIISIPIQEILKVTLLNTNHKFHLLIFIKSENPSLKKAAFQNTYNKKEGYFIFAGSEKDLIITPKTKNVITDKEICKWFLILNYLLLNNIEE